MSSTQDYLKKYMSKPASLDEHKKRKLKKKKTSTSTKSTVKKGNFAIHDEDEVSWTNAAASDSDDDLPVVEQPKAPVYKSNSSSWSKVREGEPEPSREAVLKRNVVPEWDDVENEDERPSIAGIEHEIVRIEVQIYYPCQQRTFTVTTSETITLSRSPEVTFSSARTCTVFSLTFEVKITYSPEENAFYLKVVIALRSQEKKESISTVKIEIEIAVAWS
ncbi:hypothetical protein KI688_009490 [Linnemannia hyalina]|uniref:Uncharacterized protein n=1 Tax=Linnemannia hyalina TaxID=64524 RepID=A0A9P7Y0R8_9FUNG|nr:hypothetical protein KI688_009490 [Linnemannia hyalina]